MLVLHDLTPARQLEERLEQLDRLANIGTLAAGMAHEIKNALVAGKTFVDLLLEKHQDAELVEVVRREMGRIDAIVSRMLKFAGPARPAFSEVRLHEVLEHSLRLVQPQLEGKAIVLSRSFQAAPDRVSGDDYQLQQAFVNLFLNALEAMGPQRRALRRHGSLFAPSQSASRGGASVARAQLRVADQRQRRRHSTGTHGPPVRAVLHHQAQGHRPGPAHHAAHHPGASGRHHRRKPARPGHGLPDPAPGLGLMDAGRLAASP